MSYGFLSFKLELNPLWSDSLAVHRLNKKMLINSTPPYIHASFSKIILFYKLFCTHYKGKSQNKPATATKIQN